MPDDPMPAAPPQHYQTLARYNHWANARLLDAIDKLDADDFTRDLKGFFRSIAATLNHILIVDRLWLARLYDEKDVIARYTSLDEILCATPDALRAERRKEDERIIGLTESLSEDALVEEFSYVTMSAGAMTSTRHHVWTHLFNHATHHRGQVHGMISLAGDNPPPLDLIFYLRDVRDGVAV
ncbi:MAG: DinB family protein [Magnetovibrionaceae bacterium]